MFLIYYTFQYSGVSFLATFVTAELLLKVKQCQKKMNNFINSAKLVARCFLGMEARLTFVFKVKSN